MKKPPTITPAEAEVLRYVAAHHPVTVREAADRFAADPGWARTTVLTLMERLRSKGYLTRTRTGGVNRYSPAAPQSEMLVGIVREFVRQALGGSVAPFVAYLGQEAALTDAELDGLREVLHRLEEQREEGQR